MGDEELVWLGEADNDRHELAVIWATVDLERALGDLGVTPAHVAATKDDPLLGARVIEFDEQAAGNGRGVEGPAGPRRIALAEPSTEGRLAAFLARHGEGPAGRYVGVALGLGAIANRAAAAGIALSRREIGPFGPEVLVTAGATGGAFLILVEIAAVPSRP